MGGGGVDAVVALVMESLSQAESSRRWAFGGKRTTASAARARDPKKLASLSVKTQLRTDP